MKVLITTHWVQDFLKDWEKEFPTVEFVGGTTGRGNLGRGG